MSKTRNLLVFVSLVEVFAIGIKFLTQIAIARIAGAHEYGLYTLALTWANTLAIPAGLGLSAMVIRFIPAYLATNDLGNLKGLLRFSRNLTISASIFVAAAAAFAVWLHTGSAPTTAVLLALALIPLIASNMLQAEILRASRRLYASRLVPNVVQPLAVLFIVLFFWWNGSMSGTIALLCTLVGLAITAAIQALFTYTTFRPVQKYSKLSSLRRLWLGVSLQLLWVKLAQLILNNSDIILVGIFLGPLQAGIYGAAIKAATLTSIVSQAVNLAVPPEIARLIALDNWHAVEIKLRYSAKFAFPASTIFAGTLSLLSSQIMGIFGQAFEAGASALIILAGGRMVTAWTGTVGSLLNVTGHQKITIIVYSVAAIIQLILLIVLIPSCGIVGAALASTSAMIFWNVALYIRTMQVLPITLWPIPIRKVSS